MLTHTYHLRLLELLLNLFHVFYLALVLRVFRHGFGQQTEIKIADIGPVPLEVRVLLEETIELIPPDLPLEQNIPRIAPRQLLHLIGNRERQYPLPRPELHINVLIANESEVVCLLCDQLGLEVVVGGLEEGLLLVALDVVELGAFEAL